MKILFVQILLLSFLPMPSFAQQLPENPRDADKWSRALGIPKENFIKYSHLLDRFEEVYRPIIAEDGEIFNIHRYWQIRGFLLRAHKTGSEKMIDMSGSVLRHPSMTVEGLAVMLCHEMGHLQGGLPLFERSDYPLTAGGQADYYATSKCMRMIYTDAEQEEYIAQAEIDPLVDEKCSQQFGDRIQRITCMRSAMAALAAARILDTPNLSYASPDPKVVDETFLYHPGDQCRLDTYFRGALCEVDKSVRFSYEDPNAGACTGDSPGARPSCWYKE